MSFHYYEGNSSSLNKASIFSLHFPEEIDEYESLDPVEGFFDGATLKDHYQHELDLLVVTQMSGLVETPIVGLSDMFDVMVVESVVEPYPSITEVTPPFGAQLVVPEVFTTSVVETVNVSPSIGHDFYFIFLCHVRICLIYF